MQSFEERLNIRNCKKYSESSWEKYVIEVLVKFRIAKIRDKASSMSGKIYNQIVDELNNTYYKGGKEIENFILEKFLIEEF